MKDKRKSAHLSTGIFWHGSGAFWKNSITAVLMIVLFQALVATPCRQVASPSSTVLYSKVWALQNQRAAEICEGSKLGWIFFSRQTGRGLVFVCFCGIYTLVWVNSRDLTNLTPQSRWLGWESSLKWSYLISGNDQLHPDSSLSTLDEVVRGLPSPGRTLYPLPWQKCDTWKARWICGLRSSGSTSAVEMCFVGVS